MMRSEFRKDIVSGDWVLIASTLKKKPNFFAIKKPKASKKNCPFEDLQKTQKVNPLFWSPLPKAKGLEREKISSWFLQVLPNKYPILTPHKVCPVPLQNGPYAMMAGVGFQELVITRDHNHSLGYMTKEELSLIIEAYLARYLVLKKEKCVEYILIFHNNGPSAGATVSHPHSQILALPVIPLDVSRSLAGSAKYFKEHRKCVHCDVLKKELRDKTRIIYRNKDFIAITPYASHVSFETRLYPIKHSSNFEDMSLVERENLSDIMRSVFAKIKNGMNDPDYNFFIHTAPTKARDARYYHWHLEILPRTSIWGGVELGTGLEVIKVPPEESAKLLRHERS